MVIEALRSLPDRRLWPLGVVPVGCRRCAPAAPVLPLDLVPINAGGTGRAMLVR
jgi:hypothetical protein